MGPCFGQWALRIIIKWQWTYGYQKILIEEYYIRRILYYVPPTRATGPLQSLRVTFCMNEVRRKQIYSIEWELRWWFSACHCERNVSLYDALSQNDILLPSAHNNQPLDYPRQSAWWYMLKQTYILYNELGDMSSCTSAMWQYEPRYAQITNENWVIFFNFTQQSTLLQRYLWDERSLMDAWDQVVLIMRNHIIQTVNGAIDHSEVV